ncbi:hypothetical protein AFLA_012919 [Aspergillus flavus NRRL3357]|nr:hypothetical protein AFLA_012919 [Aspergillus flavus NRRL3357]
MVVSGFPGRHWIGSPYRGMKFNRSNNYYVAMNHYLRFRPMYHCITVSRVRRVHPDATKNLIDRHRPSSDEL